MVTKITLVIITILALLSSVAYGNIVVLAIDRSGSSSNQLVKAKATMPAIVEQLQPGDRFWLIVFDNTVDQTDYTITQENMEVKKNEILESINAIQTTSSDNEKGTEIIDAWRICILGLNQAATDEEQRICVFISDGQPDNAKVMPELPRLRCRPNVWLVGYTNLDREPNLLKIITSEGINPTLVQLETIDEEIRVIENTIAIGHDEVIAKIIADEQAQKAKHEAEIKTIAERERKLAEKRITRREAQARKIANQNKRDILTYAQKWWWIWLAIIIVLLLLATRKKPKDTQDETPKTPVENFRNVHITLKVKDNQNLYYDLELKDDEFFLIGENQFVENPSVTIEDVKGYMKLWYDEEGLHIIPDEITVTYYKGDQQVMIMTPITIQQDPVTLMIGDDHCVTITTQEV